MNGLALCAGIGGFELGLRLVLPEYRTVCYVEREGFAASRLAERAMEGYLDQAPIWDDLRTFDGLPFRDRVHIITAGFPCQPFSQAGPRTGISDPRWLWPRIFEIARDVRPSYVFLENSPQIRKQGLPLILGDLSGAGFDAEWDVFSAEEEGYPHRRSRLYLLAANPDRIRQQQPRRADGEGGRRSSDQSQTNAADTNGQRGLWTSAPGPGEETDGRPRDSRQEDASDSSGARRQDILRECVSSAGRYSTPERDGRTVAANADDLDGNGGRYGAGTFCGRRPGAAYLSGSEAPECAYWCAQSGVCVVDDGSPYRLDEIRASGNAVVPEVAARAWTELVRRIVHA
ncbi:MAG: DNA cytosine methyltransferase [Armatimonadetes bacterium]|nr:DNA cytosine methyltransferase [Armatimonadota bacterium]